MSGRWFEILAGDDSDLPCGAFVHGLSIRIRMFVVKDYYFLFHRRESRINIIAE